MYVTCVESLNSASLVLEHVSLDEPGRRAQTRLYRLLRPVSQQWTARVPALGIVIYIKSPDKPQLTPHHEPVVGRSVFSLAHSRWNSLKSSSSRNRPAARSFPLSIALSSFLYHVPVHVFPRCGLQFANISRPVQKLPLQTGFLTV